MGGVTSLCSIKKHFGETVWFVSFQIETMKVDDLATTGKAAAIKRIKARTDKWEREKD